MRIRIEDLKDIPYSILGHLVTTFIKTKDGEDCVVTGTASLYVRFNEKYYVILTSGHNFY